MLMAAATEQLSFFAREPLPGVSLRPESDVRRRDLESVTWMATVPSSIFRMWDPAFPVSRMGAGHAQWIGNDMAASHPQTARLGY